jgi:hypothetical protein
VNTLHNYFSRYCADNLRTILRNETQSERRKVRYIICEQCAIHASSCTRLLGTTYELTSFDVCVCVCVCVCAVLLT